METHKKIALIIYFIVAFLISGREDIERVKAQLILLAICLIPILFYRLIARFSGFGFPEIFAKDYGKPRPAEPYAFFFWLLYLIACGFIVFKWSIY